MKSIALAPQRQRSTILLQKLCKNIEQRTNQNMND